MDTTERARHDLSYVHEAFGQMAACQPDAPAVVSTREILTYQQLSRSVNQLAHHLQSLGVGPESVVGVCLERGAGLVRSLLAVLAAGGVYLPLDPALPDRRLSQMRDEAGAGFVLTGSARARAFADGNTRVTIADDLAPVLAGLPDSAPACSLREATLAYVIHTSGSTGRPKAVAVSHASLACVIGQLVNAYWLTPGDRVVQLASVGFDTSLEQMLVTLVSGAALVLPGPGVIAPSELIALLRQQRVSVVDLTPAYWHQVLTAAGTAGPRLASVRLVITGGDQANVADCRAALQQAAPGARLVNAYGLTETTITSAVLATGGDGLPPQPSAPVPVGTPLPHAQIRVLGEDLKPVAIGQEGEIYLGGHGVARGYQGRPRLTAERFVPDPYSDVPGARMYRTGDLGRRREDQTLEVTGRADRQLKIRGFRVEPAEIEAALAAHPAIGQAAVVAHDLGGGDRQLVAYYTVRAGEAMTGPPVASLRAFLADQLPGFMIPAVFTVAERLPLTPEGKIDRQALSSPPAVPAQAGPPAEDTLPTTLQRGMGHLWAQVLGVGQVGPADDFFQLGGSSLLAAEMLARARVMFGIDADQVRALTRALLRDPTLGSFSDAAQRARARTLAAEGDGQHLDVTREAALTVPVCPPCGPPPDWRHPANVLLTGATGFLGVHLLADLLASTGAQVHCLVRAQDCEHGLRRIAEAAQRYGLTGLPLGRVRVLPGDLTKPGLGLDGDVRTELARSIDIIYHAGALVNFIYPYSELRAANVTGTAELIRIAGLCRRIPIHFVSTIAVLAGLGYAGAREVSEDTPLAHVGHLGVGYVESKFVAEEMLRKAARAGLPVAIYRPLDIVGGQQRGMWNTATEMCALVRFMTDTGLAPDIDLPLDFVPADVCAAAIRHISTHAAGAGTAYHLASPGYALLGTLTGRLREAGYDVRELPYAEWVSELLRFAAGHPSHPMTPFVPLFVDRCAGSTLTVAEMYLAHHFPSYGRAHTVHALRGSGIDFPPVDDDLLDLQIRRLMDSGCLPAPPGRHTAPPVAQMCQVAPDAPDDR